MVDETSSIIPESTLAAPIEVPTEVETSVESVESTPEVEMPAEVIEAVTEVPKSAETILGGAETPKVETPASEESGKIKVEEQPAEQEVTPSEEPAPLPTYEEFTAPEGFTLDVEQIGDFSKALAEFEVKTKADHAEVQALGQSLIERHVAEVKKSVEAYHASLIDQFEQQKTSWREAFENDPEIGGNRKDTTANAALEFIRTHGGTPEQQSEFRQLMEQSGMGNHPAMIRMLAKANMALAEGRPLPAQTPGATVQNKVQKRYGTI